MYAIAGETRTLSAVFAANEEAKIKGHSRASQRRQIPQSDQAKVREFILAILTVLVWSAVSAIKQRNRACWWGHASEKKKKKKSMNKGVNRKFCETDLWKSHICGTRFSVTSFVNPAGTAARFLAQATVRERVPVGLLTQSGETSGAPENGMFITIVGSALCFAAIEIGGAGRSGAPNVHLALTLRWRRRPDPHSDGKATSRSKFSAGRIVHKVTRSRSNFRSNATILAPLRFHRLRWYVETSPAACLLAPQDTSPYSFPQLTSPGPVSLICGITLPQNLSQASCATGCLEIFPI